MGIEINKLHDDSLLIENGSSLIMESLKRLVDKNIIIKEVTADKFVISNKQNESIEQNTSTNKSIEEQNKFNSEIISELRNLNDNLIQKKTSFFKDNLLNAKTSTINIGLICITTVALTALVGGLITKRDELIWSVLGFYGITKIGNAFLTEKKSL